MVNSRAIYEKQQVRSQVLLIILATCIATLRSTDNNLNGQLWVECWKRQR